MSFGDVIKKELISKPIKDKHCKIAFLAGIIRGSGVLVEREDGVCLEFKVYNEELLDIVLNYLEFLFNYRVREISVSSSKFSKNDKFIITLTPDITFRVLFDFGILKEEKEETSVDFDFYSKLCNKDCCFKSFLKGLFISSGGCTAPLSTDSRTRYHLEISFSHSIPAQDTAGRLYKYGIATKILKRKDQYVLYIKSKEEIKDFIAFLPAPVSVLKLTDIFIEREISNDSNRGRNCDIANLNRQFSASQKLVTAIDKIDKTIGLSSLKKDLKETAEKRLEFREDSLEELAEKLGITKSCLNHRLRKILSISNEI